MSRGFFLHSGSHITEPNENTAWDNIMSANYRRERGMADPVPVRHKKYGLGWKVYYFERAERYQIWDVLTFFFTVPDIMIQEMIAAEMIEKRRRGK